MSNIDEVIYRIKSVISNNICFKNHVYIVGGYVRDIINNKEAKDIDLVTDIKRGNIKLANLIYNNFHNVSTIPIKLGHYPIQQFQFIDLDETIEIADTMSETFPNQYSRQRNVKFASLENDILRRDFTVNSLLINLSNDKIIDLTNYGIDDIHNGIIRCNPNVDINEILSADPLRILRGIRFAVTLGWKIEEKTFNAMKECGYRINIISNERILAELRKIAIVPYGILQAVELMNKLDILQYIFPEVNNLKYIYQAPDSRKIHLEGSSISCLDYERK